MNVFRFLGFGFGEGAYKKHFTEYIIENIVKYIIYILLDFNSDFRGKGYLSKRNFLPLNTKSTLHKPSFELITITM